MTIPQELEVKIKALVFEERWPIGTVARTLGIHHSVVRRVCAADGRTQPRVGRPRPRQLDAYLHFIREQLERYPDLVSTRIFDMLRQRGYQGSERRVRAVVAELRPRRGKERALHVEVLPGEQSQVDWAYLGTHLVDGAPREVWLFVEVLSWSRAIYAEVVLDLTCAGLLRSLLRAAQWFRGTTRHWLFDNPKTVVLDRGVAGVRFNPDLLELASALHVQIQVCTPRRANEKGRVERAIRYLRERHFAARPFVNRAQANAELRRFLETTALDRPHMEDREKTVRDLLVVERDRLLALPDELPNTTIPRVAKTNPYGYVVFETNEYAAPGALRGETVELWVDDETVRLARGGTCIAEYPRWFGRRRRIGADRLDRVDAALRKDRSGRSGRQRLIGVTPLIIPVMEAWLDEGRNVGSQVSRALRILDLYGDAAFRAGVEELSRAGTNDLGALERLCGQHARPTGRSSPVALRFAAHVQDREVQMPALESYDE
jgi:transposase